MSNVIASERTFTSSAYRRLQQPAQTIPNTDHLDLEYDDTRLALWTFLAERAPAYASLEVIQDLLSVDNVYATSLAANPEHELPVKFKIIASKRPGVFSLGGDLASFRCHIDQRDRNALTHYAHTALDAIWSNTQSAGVDDMLTAALVQGEAQGGGFEAALSTHLLVAEKGAMFGFPEALFGMFPGMGGYALLSARTNAECAKRLIGSTNRYSAEMLYEMGVVDVLAEKGRGKQTLDDWMLRATPEMISKYRSRFSELDQGQLIDSVEQWVDQALCLNQRQLRTMGYILEAQKRASRQIPKATVTRLRRSIGFDDLDVNELKASDASDVPLPLVITPKTAKRFNEVEFLSFVKKSRPWIYENLSQHGAMLLKGFPNTGTYSLTRLSAALRSDRMFNALRSIPTPAPVRENVFRDDCWLPDLPQAPHNACSDCAIFPSLKVLACDDNASVPGNVVSLANTRSIYQSLSHELVLDFEKRGITYRRHYPSAGTTCSDLTTTNQDLLTWQNIFKTEQQDEVERKCRANGLNYHWNSDSSIDVWNSAPACISHTDTGDRLWFNQIHLFDLMTNMFAPRKNLLSRLLKPAKPQFFASVSYSDGTAIPQEYIEEISATYRRFSVEVNLAPGEFLLIDNLLCAQGRFALEAGQSPLITAY